MVIAADYRIRHSGGPANLRNHENVSLLESPQLLHAAGIAQLEDQVTLTVSHQGHVGNVVLPALPPDPSEHGVNRLRYLAAHRLSNESDEWQSALPNLPVALWLQDPDQAFRLLPVPALASDGAGAAAECHSGYAIQRRRRLHENCCIHIRFAPG